MRPPEAARGNMFRKLVVMFAFGLALVAGTAGAAITTYSGLDAGVGPGGAHPNSTAAAATFNTAASALGTVTTEDFESAALGAFTNLALPNMTVTTSNVTAQITDSLVLPLIEGYNTTTGGSKYLKVTPPFGIGTSSVTMTFDNPISAWGAWFTGVGTVPNTAVSVVFDDGTTQSYNPPGSASGGIAFFGFTDPGKAIASVTVQEVLTGAARDIFGIDDVQFVDALPTTADQCKKGGWESYGVFKNQGDCVSFVATGGKNPPAGG
jgi:hypothetical protein